jgi:hypothetical protein
MANEINLNNGITGLTVTAKLYSGSTLIGPTINLTEVSGALGRYTGSMPSTAAGVYGVLFYAAGAQIGSGKIEWNGTLEVTALVLESDINAITGGGGSGANPVTIMIQTTSSVAIQGATVTAWKNGMIEGTLATNVSGVSVLSLDNGTYSIVVTANGYQGNTASLVVSGATSQTYQLTAITITPSPSGGVTGYLYTTDTTGTVIQSGVVVSIQMTRTASGATGEAVSPVIKTVTSDSNGLAQFVGLTPLATYRFSTTRGNSWATFVAGSSTFEITSAVV